MIFLGKHGGCGKYFTKLVATHGTYNNTDSATDPAL